MTQHTVISGKFTAPNLVTVLSSSGHKLVNGQTVLVCRPTQDRIIDYTTGKVMGTKERILGTGIVKKQDDNAITIVVKPTESYFADKQTINFAMAKRRRSMIPARIRHFSPKRFVRTIDNNVVIKPVIE